MEDKLVTLAILTYTKAQILKNVLENEGIETYIHNVNQIQPVVSSGVRLRIKESDLPRALKITITLTSYKRNIFSRLFNPGIARKMIFHSDTPLLVING